MQHPLQLQDQVAIWAPGPEVHMFFCALVFILRLKCFSFTVSDQFRADGLLSK